MAKIYYYICIWAVCLLAACSAGDDATSFPGQADAENRVGVTLQLSALSSQTSQSSRSSLTRAGWETDTEAWPGEMMKSWFVVVVQNGQIEKIITSDLKSGVTEVEKDQAFVELNKGETTFYSFANIKPEDIELDAITSVGQQLRTGFDQKTYQMDGNSKLFHQSMAPDLQNGYPMSNKQIVNITDNQQVINLEVIRMVAKVQLSITNATDHAIVLKTITLSDVTQNGNQNIKLLPNVDSANELKGVNLPDGVAKGTITLTAAENNGMTIEARAKQTACFYMNESLVDKGADGGNRYFILSLTTVDATTGTTSNHRYAMLSWNEIRRNDYLKIPIKLEDYQIRWTVEAFSPIGVLPKVKDDGENLSLDFGYYGEFHIKPEVIKLSRTGSQTLPVSEWQMGTDAAGSDGWKLQEQNPEGADGVNIFDSSPAWVPSAYRLEGEMGNRTGSSIYTMKIKVKEQNGLGMYPIISRKVRFTMKQINLTRAGKNTEKIVLNTKTFGYESK
ncbi:hypothetical protein [Segatella copri]|uniref:Uncharacterized protein n=1 Tax=Segatella copri DSM 18205 TaxID=537011 RepID=D1PGP1_9BACT|nr:hypothetical protein [Segatella copri]EFB34158.1 hypothetical protein PREVCOP_06406 [Segatella copri DSM 18205]MCW4097636.1 hypothetical protein [Segatella copri]MQP20996.1 hypothetical protein [Segatella copri DSM 18205]UEA42898.1 hypothetical protein LK433_13190 [Segatella copri DSM 18205]UWP52491.1 hypothetical protein NQ544_00820 [Segatella copri DSM 18205]